VHSNNQFLKVHNPAHKDDTWATRGRWSTTISRCYWVHSGWF
jgi:hypothetical protein